jgi:hypothetical protein
MDLFVIQSDFDEVNQYFIVDLPNLLEKTELIDDYPEFERLELAEELKVLKVFADGGGENWEVIKGESKDFYIAVIKEITW